MNNDNRINTILNKMNNYFTNKYPTTYPIIGLSETDLKRLITKTIISTENKTSNTLNANDNKQMLTQNINNLISIIERKITKKIYSENRQNKNLDTNKFTLDPKIDNSNKSYNEDFHPKDLVGSTDMDKDTLSSGKNIKDINYNNLSSNELNNIIKSYNLDKNSDKVNISLTSSHLEYINKLLNKPDEILKDRDSMNLLYEEEREFDYNIVIDSKDRDYVKYKSPNNFVIDFNPAQGNDDEINIGYINKKIVNVIKCELISIIILDTRQENDSSDKTNPINPYLLLEIHELGGNYEGTNDELNKSFAILTNFSIVNGYKHFSINSVNSDYMIKKLYNPRININKMTIKLKNPDGTLYNFGNVNENNTNTVFKLSFRFTTLQKNLGTNFIN